VSQPWIQTVERSSLLTRIAMTEGVVRADQAVITKGFASVTPHLTIRASEMKTSRREGGDF